MKRFLLIFMIVFLIPSFQVRAEELTFYDEMRQQDGYLDYEKDLFQEPRFQIFMGKCRSVDMYPQMYEGLNGRPFALFETSENGENTTFNFVYAEGLPYGVVSLRTDFDLISFYYYDSESKQSKHLDTWKRYETFRKSGGGRAPFGIYDWKICVEQPDKLDDWELDSMYYSSSVSTAYYFHNYRLFTDIPLFREDDEESLNKYLESGDTAGAINSVVAKKGANKKIYDGSKLQLHNRNYFTNELKVGNIDNRSFRTSFEIYNPDNYTDLSIDVDWEVKTYLKWGLSSFKYDNGETWVKGTINIPLQEFDSYFTINPSSLVESAAPSDIVSNFGTGSGKITKAIVKELMYGYNLNSSVSAVFGATITDASVSSSIFSMNYVIKGKHKGDTVSGGGYSMNVPLTGSSVGYTEEYQSTPDDEGNYTKDETTKVVKDDKGNDVPNNKINVENGTGGNSSSNASIGDLNFVFPDNINIHMTVDGIVFPDGSGGGSGGGSDGSGGGSDGSGGSDSGGNGSGILKRVGQAISDFLDLVFDILEKLITLLTDLLKSLMDGLADLLDYFKQFFNIFGSNEEVNNFFATNYSFVPEGVWRILILGLIGVVVIGIIKKFL